MLSFRCTVCLLISKWNYLTITPPSIYLTWSELFDAALAAAGVHGQEVFEPGDLRVGDAAGGAQHGGRPRPLHHLQLGTHVYTGEAKWQQVLWKDEEKENI